MNERTSARVVPDAADRGLEGRRIIVTGATRGIGRTVATDLARRGARVLGVGRDVERGGTLAVELAGGSGTVDFVVADLADLAGYLEQMAAALEHPVLDYETGQEVESRQAG